MRATGLGGLGLVLAALALLEGLAEPLGSRADAGRKWWETAVVYQVYPRSFKDSNGDGVGDLPGITSKLEYLRDLGVGAVWLSPIFPSPQKDFGYDISDFVGIDPQYGTMDDFDALLKRAHELGLKVVLDYVPNHSSDQHEWFQKSVKKEGKYTDYYVWHDAKIVNGVRQPPTNWISNFRGSAWKWNEERQQYYLHQFVDEQPDLNFRSQDVVAEMKEVIRFWLKKGVDGIRVDTIISLFEDTVEFRDEPVNEGGETDPEEHGYLNHIYTENLPETYDMVQQWREVLEEFDDQRVMMTEAYATLEQTMAYYGTEERPGASFSFNFYLITKLSVSSKATDFKQVIDDWMGQMNDFRKPNWVIGNHDQFRVGSFFRYGAELADGIHMISLMLPGTAMTYNGEEIDMDNTYITWEQTKDPQAVNTGSKNYLMRSRDLARTPFQWDDTTSAGFSTSKSTWLPVNPNYWRLNLKKQMNDEHSHFKIYKALMEARKKPAVQSSSYKASTIGSDVLIIARELSGEDSFYSVINFGSEENVVDLSTITAESSNTFDKLYVWTSSINSILRPGNTVTASLTLRPKEAVVLTTSVSAATRSALSATLFAVLIVLGLRA